MAVLQERDLEVIDLMCNFGGKTFKRVLAETCFRGLKNPMQQAANRIYKIKKNLKIFKFVDTGLAKDRYALALNKAGVEYCNENGYDISQTVVISTQSVNHTIVEQIAFYFLKKMGKDVERTIVAKWSKEHAHTPDLMYKNEKNELVYVEIELSKKSTERYLASFSKMKKDGVKSVLYVFENEKKMAQIGRIIPTWDAIRYITKDELVVSFETGKMISRKQIDFKMEIEKNEING